MTDDYFLFVTRRGNRYCFHRSRAVVMGCHPILHHLMGLHRSGASVQAWLDSFEGEAVHLDGVAFSRAEAEHQLQKLALLQRSGFFSGNSKWGPSRALSARLGAADIEALLATTPQILFELTERCNLRCEYCYLGDLYTRAPSGPGREMRFEDARLLLDHIGELRRRRCRDGSARRPGIAFVGGEPLLSFETLREIVDHARQLFGAELRIDITTNGLLLQRFGDFLARNEVRLAISLDGDEVANGCRRTPEGAPVFEQVLRNVTGLREDHPSYFERCVSFNAVLTSRTSIRSIRSFFLHRFGKEPGIADLTPDYVNPAHEARWRSLFVALGNSRECTGELDRELFLRLPMPAAVSRFLLRHAPCHFHEYRNAVLPAETSFYPTGTCLPFSRRIFLTARGEVLPCDHVARDHPLGWVRDGRVELDPAAVAAYYNGRFDRLAERCRSCERAFDCPECMFLHDPERQPDGICRSATDEAAFGRSLVAIFDYLEDNPWILSRALQDEPPPD